MNTSAVAKMLGVSPSTIQRWVKQANLQMERTELGHFQFSEESIGVLKTIQEQLNQGVLLQDLKIPGKKPRKAAVTVNDTAIAALSDRVERVESELRGKADDVVSYQLLQHRQEIEELKTEVARLKELLQSMHQAAVQLEPPRSEESKPVFSTVSSLRKYKKRNILSSFFGF